MKVLLVALLALGACTLTAGCQAPQVEVVALLAAMRMDSPGPGKNKVCVYFQDLSAQGGSFEETIEDGLRDALADRGYEVVNFPDGADFTLWATLRVFLEVKGEEETIKILTGLGGVAGAVATAATINALGGNSTAAVLGGVGGAVAGGYIVNKLTLAKTYIMVVDLQLGSRRAMKIVYHETFQNSSQSADTPTPPEAHRSSHSPVRESFFAELEQRLLATAKGQGLSKEAARKMLIPKLIDAINSQLPHYDR